MLLLSTTLRSLSLLAVFLLSISLQQALAQAELLTEIRSFPGIVSTTLEDIPLYGNTIVSHKFRIDGEFEVFDLDGESIFAIDYADGIASSSSFHRARFVEEVDLLDAGLVEVVFAVEDTDRNLHIRRFNEKGNLNFSHIIPSTHTPDRFPYFFTDQNSKQGFLAYSLSFSGNEEKVFVYPFSSDSTIFELEGELFNSAAVYPEIPLIVYPEEDLLVGYDVRVQEIIRMEPMFGADNLTAPYADIGHDGVLDAYSFVDTLIGGQEATRAIWYDIEGTIYLDTFLMGRVFGIARWGVTGLLPSEAGFYGLRYRLSSDVETLEFRLRSDTGQAIGVNEYYRTYNRKACYKGETYLLNRITRENILDTLYNSRSGKVVFNIPQRIFYENQAANLQNVIGKCDVNDSESIALVYNQPRDNKLVFTNADTLEKAVLPFINFASASRFDESIYAFSDVNSEGEAVRTLYRINEQVSNTQRFAAPLALTLAPNPARDYFKVIADDKLIDQGALEVHVYTASGREVALHVNVQQGRILEVPEVPGVYFIQASQPATGYRVTEKLVVR